MTTIRRITVSQINGNDANANEPDEIRPHGEMGLYGGEYIQNIDNDRLELLIHDGKRTHLKSKVLSPGIFYGSNADSGDGLGLDTIKLVPDSALYYNNGSYGNDQYIIVDPTQPNHIHLRAGGTIDNSTADLILGGEKNSVIVSDSSKLVVISTDNGDDGTNFWLFGSNGNLTFPNSGEVVIGGDNEVGRIIPSVSDGTGLTVQADVDLELKVSQTVDDITETAIWSFESNGSITFPDTTVQTTAWAGGRVVSVPTTSAGASGDKAGDIAFNAGYIYYCTADYGSGTTTTIPWSSVGNWPGYVEADIASPGLLSTGDLQITNNAVNGETGITVPVDSYELVSGSTYRFYITVAGWQSTYQNSELQVTTGVNIWRRVAWSADTW